MKTSLLQTRWPSSVFDSIFNLDSSWFENWSNSLYSTAPHPLDISETENSLYVEVPLAGFKKEEIEVSILDSVLSINAKKNPSNEKRNKIVARIKTKNLVLSINLHDLIDEKTIKCSFKDGLLCVEFEKQIKSQQKIKSTIVTIE